VADSLAGPVFEIGSPLTPRFKSNGLVLDHARVTEINGPIGFMRRDLRTCLFASPHTARRGESERKAESSVAGWQSGERLPTPVVEKIPL